MQTKPHRHTRALITGGSKGLGLALALQLGRQGAHVAIVARHSEALDASLLTLRDQGVTAYGITADVGNPAAATAIAAQAQAHLGQVNLLIHNASTLGPLPMPTLSEIHSEDLARVFEVNVLGPHRLTRAIGGNMILRGRGTILNISSDAAVSAYAGWGAYSAAKAALDHMTRVWAAETEESELRFVSIDPGEMNTEMHANALPDADPDSLTSPATVASHILDILADTLRAPTGSRLEAQEWEHRS